MNQLDVMDIPDTQCQILRESLAKNPFGELQQEFRSYFLLDKCIKNSAAFKFNEPREVWLDPENKISFQYVSIVDTLLTVATDPGFKRKTPQQMECFEECETALLMPKTSFSRKIRTPSLSSCILTRLNCQTPLVPARENTRLLMSIFRCQSCQRASTPRQKTNFSFCPLRIFT
jgi:hypothetical protein